MNINKKDSYLYIFLHIPKSAGTTFRIHARKNLPKDQQLEIEFADLNLPEGKLTKKDYMDAVEKYLSSLSQKQKNKLKIITGPTLPYGIHKFFNKKARYFTFLRYPPERAISIYNSLITTYKREPPKKQKHPRYKALLINGKIPSFKEWLKNKYATDDHMINYTTLFFLERLGYIEKNAEKDLAKKFFFMGLTNNFHEDALYLYNLLGFNKFFMNVNVSKKYISSNQKEIVTKTIPNKMNKIIKLYNVVKKYNSELKRKKEYKDTVSIMKLKRFLLLPFTQVIIDFPGLKRELKNSIKDYILSKTS